MRAAPASLPRGFAPLLLAQFLSALADNALLIVGIAVLQQQGLPPWWAPLLKIGFNAAYVVSAPFVGPLADAIPKGRLMAWMNALKLLGAASLLVGANPVVAFAVVGLGAAAYAPAKYGLVTELVKPRQLVAANGWLEASVVCAVLLGTGLGGVLVSAFWLGVSAPMAQGLGLAGVPLAASLVAVLAVYAAAAVVNLGVPESGARYGASHLDPMRLTREFVRGNLTLWRDRDGGLSLAVTTLLWGIGATLQFVVLRWSAEALGLTLDRGAYLQAAAAVGVVAGAMLAGRWVALGQAKRLLPLGVLLGALLPAMLLSDSVPSATGMLVVLGALSGFLVVPMNALLQERGCAVLSAGRSIAVQGCNENAGILVMLALYAALSAAQAPIEAVIWMFGAFVVAGVGAVIWVDRRRAPDPARARALL